VSVVPARYSDSVTTDSSIQDRLARDEEQLRWYRAELVQTEEVLREYTASVNELRQIVTGLEARVERLRVNLYGAPEASDEDADPNRRDESPGAVGEKITPSDIDRAHARSSVEAAGTRLSLTEVLRKIMADGRVRNIDAVVEELRAYGYDGTGRRQRQTVTNRLYDLMEADYLERLRRGVYQLKNGSGGASNDAAQPEQLVPDAGINRTG
jgi:hypothetical protein